MGAHVERGVSAPPEVVFNTATDPDRFAAWLPAPLRAGGRRPAAEASALRARWPHDRFAPWSAVMHVRQVEPGGALVEFELDGDLSDRRLAELADQSLARLAEHVADNLTAG
jgi:uncharacterized protein YndB with AHSA1/START domain